MRTALALLLGICTLPAGRSAAQNPADGTPHIAVEATILVLDDARVTRLGLGGLEISHGGATGASVGAPSGTLRIGTRIGSLDVSAFLDLVRSERAVRQEIRQTVLTLSGSPAQVSSQRTVVGAFGHSASAGPSLWVEPIAQDDGRILLRVWTAVGEVHRGPFGSVWEEIPVDARTELVVPTGTPVVIAVVDRSTERADRDLLARGSASDRSRAWVVVRPRIVTDPADAFPMPDGIPPEWLGSTPGIQR